VDFSTYERGIDPIAATPSKTERTTSGQPCRHGAKPHGKKRILIDASPVTGIVDGLSIYIVNLIKSLPPAASAEFEFTVLLNPGVDWADLNAAMRDLGIGELRARIAPIGPRRDWDMFRFLRRHRGEFDLVHITSNNYPFALRGGVCTIHDVTFKRWFDKGSRLPGWLPTARLYLSLVIGNAMRRAQAVIAVSQSTRADLETLFRPGPSAMAKVKVVHEGWEHLLDYEEGECAPFGFEDKGYLLFLGSYRVHKNLNALLEAFYLARDRIPPDRILVISGSSDKLSDGNRETLAAINAQGSRVVFTGYVSNACVRRLYQRADALVLPSLSEGFGLPVLEAFHYRTPVLCSDAASLPEVAGDAALYFDPKDPAAIAEAIVGFYGEPAIAQRLRAAGDRRLQSFSWAKTARETLAVYRQCLGLPMAATPQGGS
jgi:glycosyltransferase involved in cell wall biosynthesis